MRHTLLLVVALGLIVAAAPSVVAQEPERTTAPRASEPAVQPIQPATTPETLPATLPTAYAQPVMPGQVVSPYAPAYSSGITPCGGAMPVYGTPTYATPTYATPVSGSSTSRSGLFGGRFRSRNQGSASPYQPEVVQYGSTPQVISPAPLTYSSGQPVVQYGAIPSSFPLSPTASPYGQPLVQYGQPAVQYDQPAVGAVAGGVISQPALTGTVITDGQTFQPYQTGMVYPSGTTFQPIQSGVVYQTGAMGTYSNQPVILGGYAPSYGYAPVPAYAPGVPGYGYGGYDFGRPGYNPGGLGGPRSGLGVRPGMGFGGFGLRR